MMLSMDGPRRGATAMTERASPQSTSVLMATPGAPVVGGALILAVLLTVTGCSDSGDPTGAPPAITPTVAYAVDVQPIWDTHCTSCHGSVPSAGMDLRAAAGTAMLVNVAATGHPGVRVVPGNPAASVLFGKLQGDPALGDRMPLGGASLSAGELETVRLWIAGGALNN